MEELFKLAWELYITHRQHGITIPQAVKEAYNFAEEFNNYTRFVIADIELKFNIRGVVESDPLYGANCNVFYLDLIASNHKTLTVEAGGTSRMTQQKLESFGVSCNPPDPTSIGKCMIVNRLGTSWDYANTKFNIVGEWATITKEEVKRYGKKL